MVRMKRRSDMHNISQANLDNGNLQQVGVYNHKET